MSHSANSLLQALEPELAKARDEEKRLRARAESANEELKLAAEHLKSLQKFMDSLKGNSRPRLTKDFLRPRISSLLSERGPLSQQDLKQEFTAILRKKHVPATGIQSVMNSLRSEFAGADGLWRLENESPSPKQQTARLDSDRISANISPQE